MITVLDYGCGNVRAFCNAYARQNLAVRVASTREDLLNAERLILPGVGSFDWAMDRLQRSGMRECLDDLVLSKNIPVLGVCVGMHMLAESSEEGSQPGLGWIPAVVDRLPDNISGSNVRLPHMGWNDVQALGSPLFVGLDQWRFYFLHSYYVQPECDGNTAATTEYGKTFSSAVRNGHIHGVQFHPEKSHHFGMRLLKNFAEY